MKKIEVILLGLFLFLSPSLFAQVVDEPEDNSDGFYTKESELIENGKKAFDFPYVREADVVWAHRVWRVIDFKEKINQVFYYPIAPDQGRKNLFTILDEALTSGQIRGFDGDMFENVVNWEELKASLAGSEVIERYDTDIDGNEIITYDTIMTSLKAEDVTMLRIKEDWFIDKNRSVEDVRIIGFALIYMQQKEEGTPPVQMPLAWIRYNDPEVRELLANAEVYNMDNDRARRSYDDIFRKRIFSSYVIRESNDFNRRIEDYASGIDAWMESQRIEDYLFEMEEDMWEY
ncbi:MAG: gliding motility protein GldN [Bacteroidales bacterium]|jgi:gliding motility associated protien GldN|nr:gliding motility protein GldN [Bacteroidales bacterium]MBQ5872741.1 gliding motility protein GldN [Bacteroidales bacterium]MBQ5891309.1 gliding motility protein GldN [Bacteroidales bacterium]MEE0266661.1 gliding motility protein GldN [Bacteroidales bacterium]MEE0882541.1 gliding motility protein GldN [Bacteroidales bacterium]